MENTKKMVLIKWMDAKFCPGIHSEENILQHKMNTFKSLGFLVLRDNRATIFASECNDDGEYRDITLIPSGSIISVHKLVTKSAV